MASDWFNDSIRGASRPRIRKSDKSSGETNNGEADGEEVFDDDDDDDDDENVTVRSIPMGSLSPGLLGCGLILYRGVSSDRSYRGKKIREDDKS